MPSGVTEGVAAVLIVVGSNVDRVGEGVERRDSFECRTRSIHPNAATEETATVITINSLTLDLKGCIDLVTSRGNPMSQGGQIFRPTR